MGKTYIFYLQVAGLQCRYIDDRRVYTSKTPRDCNVQTPYVEICLLEKLSQEISPLSPSVSAN